MPRLELELTVAAMPSQARQRLSGLATGEQWPRRVEWIFTTDDAKPVARDFLPMFEREIHAPRERGRVGVGETVAAVYRLPVLAKGTYRLTALVGTLQSNVERFVVSDGTESVPLRTTYAWVQANRERSPVLRNKWLRDLGELDPTMPAPWIDLGDEALGRQDFLAAQQYYERAVDAFTARHARFAQSANAQELVREIDSGKARFTKVVALLRSASSSDGRLVVNIRRDRGKKYVLADRASGRIVQTIE